ncbi:MAG: SPASM domain-containing protein [Planctomycetota bacterium]|nr:SPASM domain-containing protein [Planctomycetota bacterium]
MLIDLPNLSRVGDQLWQRYGTPDKLDNARRLAKLTAACAERIDAFPWRIVLEPGNLCNLHCKECPTHESDLPKGLLDPADIETYLQDLWPHLVQVNLFNWGEPVLNPRLPEIIEIIHRRDVGTQVHANMNRFPEALMGRVIDSGLDFLVASIDGVSETAYAGYRVGGSAKQSLENLERFVKLRDARGTSTPKIVWRFLCFPHTLDEIDQARRLAADIGVDDFALGEGFLDGRIWTSDGPKSYVDNPSEQPVPYCNDLFDFPVIHWDGTVLPCCYVADRRFIWGDLRQSSWMDIFNRAAFREARRLVAGDTSIECPCRGCFKIPKLVQLSVSGEAHEVAAPV